MRITDALTGVQRLYIDTAPFIYYVEDHPDYAEKMQLVFDAVDSGNIEIITSVIALTETLTKPLKTGDQAVALAYAQLLESTPHITLVPIMVSVARRAAYLRSQANLRTPDALHLATAIEADCSAILTNDKSFRFMSEPRVLLLDELELDMSPNEN